MHLEAKQILILITKKIVMGFPRNAFILSFDGDFKNCQNEKTFDCCNSLLLQLKLSNQISIISKSITHHTDTFFCRSLSLKITARGCH